MSYPDTPRETAIQAALVAAFGCLVRHGLDVRLASPEGEEVRSAMRSWVIAETAPDQQKSAIAAE